MNSLDDLKCSKCGHAHIGIRTDKRGVAEYYCEDCGAGQGKASSADLVFLINLMRDSEERPEIPEPKKAPCKYCTEDYFTRIGRLGTVYVPIDNKYCPMCGREIDREKDRGF